MVGRFSAGARLVLVGALLLGALLAWQGTASAALDIRDATIDGVQATSAPPGSVLQAKITSSSSGGDRWRATEAGIGPDDTCVDHRDQNGSNRTVRFDLTAPGTPGEYDARFTARGRNDCTGPASRERVLARAVRVTTPAPNPDLAAGCGIDVILVLDESGSINTSRATGDVRRAAKAYLQALSGTGARVSIIEFNSRARRPIDYTTVTSTSIASVFTPYLDATGSGEGYNPAAYRSPEFFTNWDDAFEKTREANAAGPIADLVVFVTDGDPTAYDPDPPRTQPVTGLTEGQVEAMRRAAAEADRVKAQGSHVFALGVGAAVNKPQSARRLTAISGFHRYPGTGFAKADYTLVKDFSDLEAALRGIAVELCQGSVSVTKLVDEGDGQGYVQAKGWEFEASVTTAPGGYSWVDPPPPAPATPRTQTTGDNGVATFQWKPSNAQATSRVTIAETARPGYEFVGATCSSSASGAAPRGVVATDGRFVAGEIGSGEFLTCTVQNRRIPGTIQILKEATPKGPQAFSFGGGLGDFTLVDDTPGTTASRTFTGLRPGTYTVTEASLPGTDWTLDSIACSDPSVVVSGRTATITLASGQSIACTYRNALRPPPPGTIQILKEATPKDPQPFSFSGSLGDFTLVDDTPGVTASRTFTGLPPGTYTVTEAPLPLTDWTVDSISCTDPSAVVSGGTATITLASGQAIACRFSNALSPPVDPPLPPLSPPSQPVDPQPPLQPPIPPQPPVVPLPTPTDPQPPLVETQVTPPSEPPQTRLRVVKKIPARVRVGQVVPFRLIVKNVGRVTARNVRLEDVPPAAMSLKLLRSSARARISRGNVIWRLGNIRPGQVKVVRGVVLIARAPAGVKQNIAVVTSANTELTDHKVRTRVVPPRTRRVTPAVTG